MRNEALRAQFQQVGDGLATAERAHEQFHALLPPLSDLLVDSKPARRGCRS